MYPTRKKEKVRDTRGLLQSVNYQGPMEDAVEIARHYGFNLVEPIYFSRRLPKDITDYQKERVRKKDLTGFPPGRMAVLKKYFDEKMNKWPQPILIAHVADSDNDGKQEFRLDVIGSKKGFAEALVLRVGSIILNSWGHENFCIHLNSVGDEESAESFEQELEKYYRDNLNNLAGCCRQQMKKALAGVLECKNRKCQVIQENAPKPIGFLSESERRHLSEIIEYLEVLDSPYKINTKLIGNPHCYPRTAYKINEEKDSGEDVELARGERHENLSKEIGVNKKVPIVSLALNLRTDLRMKEEYEVKDEEEVDHPKIYFAHIGQDAKMHSLRILEMLRQERIRLKFLVNHDSINKQLRQAENEGAQYTIILGQKEVLDNTIIWRDMETRVQENVPLNSLSEYVKRLRKQKII